MVRHFLFAAVVLGLAASGVALALGVVWVMAHPERVPYGSYVEGAQPLLFLPYSVLVSFISRAVWRKLYRV